MIVDTGNWLPGRQVLLSPHAFDGFGPDGDAISVRLTKDQIENSPSIESHRPVTRQYEHDYFHYYSWPPYWNARTRSPRRRLPARHGCITIKSNEASPQTPENRDQRPDRKLDVTTTYSLFF